LRKLAEKAYERELQHELAKLDEHFGRWRSGELSSEKLDRLIRQFERGRARELFHTYHDRSLEMPVAYAISAGILRPDEVPDEVVQALQGPLDFYRSLKDRHGL
jgi:hypothetical protein